MDEEDECHVLLQLILYLFIFYLKYTRVTFSFFLIQKIHSWHTTYG